MEGKDGKRKWYVFVLRNRGFAGGEEREEKGVRFEGGREEWELTWCLVRKKEEAKIRISGRLGKDQEFA